MNKSIHSTTPHFEKQKVPRFRRLDNSHISAIESLYKAFPFLKERVEVHLPFNRAKNAFSNETLWVWRKFDKRPVGYLIFIEGFAPCIWYPDRQEGMTFRWLLPPNFSQKGATVCFANILTGESILQIEDIVISEGQDLWSNLTFSERWLKLHNFWKSIPSEQPLLAFKPQIVNPIPLSEWSSNYDASIYWIIQPNQSKQQRWFWKDIVTPPKHTPVEFVAPTLKRATEILNILVAQLVPYTKTILPDTYTLLSQEGDNLGFASIPTIELSHDIRKAINSELSGIPVEVIWNDDFNKYQVIRIMPNNTPITTASFFYHHKN